MDGGRARRAFDACARTLMCREDGDVYRALYEAAKSSPLNDTEEGPAWDAVLREHLVGEARPRL